jgi:hypothetical protein
MLEGGASLVDLAGFQLSGNAVPMAVDSCGEVFTGTSDMRKLLGAYRARDGLYIASGLLHGPG